MPGGIIRYKEPVADRIRACAREELGADVSFGAAPLMVSETMLPQNTRGHFISLLFRCRLLSALDEAKQAESDPPSPGQWRWHDRCPPDLIEAQRPYAAVLLMATEDAPSAQWTPRTRAVSFGVAALLAAVLLYYSLRGIEWRQVARIVAGAAPGRLALAAGIGDSDALPARLPVAHPAQRGGCGQRVDRILGHCGRLLRQQLPSGASRGARSHVHDQLAQRARERRTCSPRRCRSGWPTPSRSSSSARWCC